MVEIQEIFIVELLNFWYCVIDVKFDVIKEVEGRLCDVGVCNCYEIFKVILYIFVINNNINNELVVMYICLKGI